MKILIAAKHAPHGKRPIGGVQSWCRSVADEIDRRGHESYTWGPEQQLPRERFALGIIANAGDTSQAFALCDKTINVCHGIIPAEKPAKGDLVAFTSEELRDHWHVDGIIVRQPIDTEFWSSKKTSQNTLTRFSYRNGLRFVPRIAASMGLDYQHVRNVSHFRARDIIQKSVCVLATGRAALEAMSCDVPVVICDHRAAYQGPLMDTDIDHAMTRNYSGRGGVLPTITNVNEAIEIAKEKIGWRDYVIKNHSVETVVDQLLGAI